MSTYLKSASFEFFSPNFNQNILKRLSVLQREQVLCDCVLLVRHEEFYCHKILLSSCSDFFLNHFTNPNFKDPLEIDVEDIDAFKSIFGYFYSGKLNVNYDKLISVLRISKILKLKELEENIYNHLVDKICDLNVFDLRLTCNSMQESSKSISDLCDTYISRNHVSLLEGKCNSVIIVIHIVVSTLTRQIFEKKDIAERLILSLSQMISNYNFDFEFISNQSFSACLDENLDLIDFHLMVNGRNVTVSSAFNEFKNSRNLSLFYRDSEASIIDTLENSRSSFRCLAKICNRIFLLNLKFTNIGFEKTENFVDSYESKPYNGIDNNCDNLSEYKTNEDFSTNDEDALHRSDLSPCSISHFKRLSKELAPTLQTDRSAACVVLLDDKSTNNSSDNILILGGYNRDACSLSQCEIYESQSNKWSEFPSMPVARSRFAVYYNRFSNLIYTIGGSGINGSLSSVDCYSLETNNWIMDSAFMPIPSTRSGHVVVSINSGSESNSNQFILVGGRSSKQSQASCFYYDCSLNWWTSAPALITSRNDLAAAAANGAVYVVGGVSDSLQGYLSTCEMLDPRDSVGWRTLPIKLPKERSGARLLALSSDFNGSFGFGGEQTDSTQRLICNDQQMLLMGGCDNQGSTRECLICDLRNQKWMIGPNLFKPRMHPACVVSKNTSRIYAIGGFSGKAFLDSQEIWNFKY